MQGGYTAVRGAATAAASAAGRENPHHLLTGAKPARHTEGIGGPPPFWEEAVLAVTGRRARGAGRGGARQLPAKLKNGKVVPLEKACWSLADFTTTCSVAGSVPGAVRDSRLCNAFVSVSPTIHLTTKSTPKPCLRALYARFLDTCGDGGSPTFLRSPSQCLLVLSVKFFLHVTPHLVLPDTVFPSPVTCRLGEEPAPCYLL